MKEQELISLAKENNKEAINILMKKYKGITLAIAKKYAKSNYEIEDLLQESYFSFKKCIDSFDFSKNCKFSSYLYMIIERDLYEYASNNFSDVRVPLYLKRLRGKLYNYLYSFKEVYGCYPTLDQLAIKLNVNKSILLSYLPNLKDTVSLEYIEKLETEYDDSYCIIEEDDMFKGVYNDIRREEIYNFVNESSIASKFKNILILRYGLDGSRFKTLEEVGRKLFYTYREVKFYEEEALKYLRKDVKRLKLIDYNNILK